MNNIRQIQALNKRELEKAVPPSASWHADYRDTAYIYIGGLPFDLTEGDIITIFSQYGEPVHLNLVRDKETGKSRGFAFLKYEDQRSTDLAVDNLGGATVLGRMLRVDHVRYKRREEEGLEDNLVEQAKEEEGEEDGRSSRSRSPVREKKRRPLLKEEKELHDIIDNHDEEDPMKEYLIEQKKEELSKALAQPERSRDRHHHHHRSRKDRRDGSRDRHRGDEEDASRHRHSHHRHRSHRHHSRREDSRSPGREGERERHHTHRSRRRTPSQSRSRSPPPRTARSPSELPEREHRRRERYGDADERERRRR